MHLRSLLLLLVLTVSLAAAKGCDISAGNVGDFIVTYEITVTNGGPDDALLFLSGKDLQRRAIVRPGGSMHATSYVGGSILVGASPGVDVIAALNKRHDAISAKLDVKPLDLAASTAIYNELEQLSREIQFYESGQHGSQCTFDLKPDPTSGKGVNATATATLDGDRWVLAC
jgi:hypothetical protein